MATARSALDGTNGQTRATWRNGYRKRALDTRLGTLNLKAPKPRQGSYAPGFPERRKMSETALVAVMQEAWSGGLPPRRVDALAQAMGVSGGPPSSTARSPAKGPMSGWTHIPQNPPRRQDRLGCRDHCCRSQERRAEREIVGLGLGPSGAETFWMDVPRGLHTRGPEGTRLTIGAPGAAIAPLSSGCSGPLGNAVGCIGCATPWAHVSRGRHIVAVAALRKAFDRPDRAAADGDLDPPHRCRARICL